MLKNELKRDFKDMLHCKEFFFAFTASLAFLMIPLILSLTSFYKVDIIYLLPAYRFWGASATNGFGIGDTNSNAFGNIGLVSMYLCMALPFLAPLAYSSHFFDDRKKGTLNIILPRTSKKTYYTANMITCFVGSFIIAFLPLLLEQLILLICCPTSSSFISSSTTMHDFDLKFFSTSAGGSFAVFQFNHPYISNIIYCIIPAVFSGIIGVFAFAVSLFYRKSKFFPLTIFGISWMIASLFGAIIFNVILFSFLISTGNIIFALIFFAVFAAVSVFMVLYHNKRFEDESI